MKDNEVINIAQGMASLLGQNLALFQMRFPFINQGWLDGFISQIEIAGNDFPDWSVTSDLKITVYDAKQLLIEANDILSILNHYAYIAYPKDKVNQSVAGKSTWKKAKTNTLLMAAALNVAYKYANTEPIKSALFGKGYTQAELDAMPVLSQKLSDFKEAISLEKKGRESKTSARIKMNNGLLEKMKTLSVCSRVVCKNDPALRKLFRINQAKKSILTTIRAMVFTLALPVENAETSSEKAATVPKKIPVGGAIVTLIHRGKPRSVASNRKGKAEFKAVKYPKKISLKVEHEDYETMVVEKLTVAKEMNVAEIILTLKPIVV